MAELPDEAEDLSAAECLQELPQDQTPEACALLHRAKPAGLTAVLRGDYGGKARRFDSRSLASSSDKEADSSGTDPDMPDLTPVAIHLNEPPAADTPLVLNKEFRVWATGGPIVRFPRSRNSQSSRTNTVPSTDHPDASLAVRPEPRPGCRQF